MGNNTLTGQLLAEQADEYEGIVGKLMGECKAMRTELARVNLENARLHADNLALIEHREDPNADTEHEAYWFNKARSLEAEIASRDEEIKTLDELVEALEDACQIEPSALSRARARIVEVREGRKT